LVVRHRGERPAQFLRALRLAEAACRTDPNNRDILNTLGVAQYRAGQYRSALTALARSDELNSKEPRGSDPGDLAFLAMAHFRLGELEKANAALGRLRDTVKKPNWVYDSDAQGFLREAEEIKLDLAFPADPFAR
jgi:tetratricopeptide (TPR) repeat protein